MKTTKIICSILIVALATTTSAQLNQLKNHIFASHSNHTIMAYTEAQDDAMIRESMISGAHPANAYYAGSAEMIHEKELDMESWMAEAFDSGLDNELQLEEWMIEAFQPEEEALELESWMTAPFPLAEGETELRLESWMQTPFANLVASTWD